MLALHKQLAEAKTSHDKTSIKRKIDSPHVLPLFFVSVCVINYSY
jgi:hypothetical protein